MMEGLLGGVSAMLLYILLLLAGGWVWFQWRHRRIIQLASSLPYTHPPWPIIGHAYALFWDFLKLGEFVMDVSLTAVDKGLKTICIWIGPFPFIFVHDVDDIQMILNSSITLNKSDEYQTLNLGLHSGEAPFDGNLLTASGSDWRNRRRYLSLLVHQKNIFYLVSLYNKNSRELVERMALHLGQGPFDVMDCAMNSSLKTICDLMFGPDVHIDMKSDGFRNLRHFVETIPTLFMRRLALPWLWHERIYKFIYRKELKQLNAFWKDFSKTPVKLAKESSEQKMKKNGVSMETLKSTSEANEILNIVDVYTVMQQKFPQYSDTDLSADIDMLYGTGTDTMGTSVASCLLALAQYQDIQDKLYYEISSIVGPDDDITLDDISRMPLLDQVIKETLRRFTIVPFIMRKSEQDLKLSTCVVPAGYSLVLSLAGLLMDPNTFPDPYKFDPERFTQENIAKNKSYYLPFSRGPRNCLAKKYALHLMKMMVVHVLRKFHLRTQMDIQKLRMKIEATCISVEGYLITVEDRNVKCNKQ